MKSSVEGMPQDNGFFAVGAGRDDIHRYLDGLLDVADVSAGPGRQFVKRTHATGGFAPARQLFVDRLQLTVILHIHRTAEQFPTFAAIADADLQRIQSVEQSIGRIKG